LKIRAIGYQFGWRIHYAGSDGKFGRQSTRFIKAGMNDLGLDPDDEAGRDDAVVTSDMHLVLNKATVVRVSSLDVIHGFALHEMRIQQDATPGTEAPQWFRPIKKGNWQIICAQLCGTGHSGMVATYSVEDQKDFDEWYGSQRELTQSKLKSYSEEMKKAAAQNSAAPLHH
jgi:cytochrome c oxidase subunit 2